MFPLYISQLVKRDDNLFKNTSKSIFTLPQYNPEDHYLDVSNKRYFQALIYLRHYIKFTSDYYFGTKLSAKNIDLFMITSSTSSPMGPGSDSSALKIKFGKQNSNLTDSSQFGFEPLLLNGLNKVYCYLPSMRGENPDKRHLNQFFHCETEIKGTLTDIIPIAEKYTQYLSEILLLMPNIIEMLSLTPKKTKKALKLIKRTNKFPEINFDDAIKILQATKQKNLINITSHGRDISAKGEIKLAEVLNFQTPFWLKNFDRDRVPFYQKPDPQNPSKTLNADLIFPPIITDSFGGEILGCGQRQDNEKEMIESLKRQKINIKNYAWYINLRKQQNYSPTSGFGLGIERFIAWALCRDDIKDVIPYPRLKDTITYP